MRAIDWDAPLSDEDKAWARQAGFVAVEDLIARNEARFGQDPSAVDVADPHTKSALDPTATASEGAVATGNTLGLKVDEDEPDDDYDDWSVKELQDEVDKRNTEAGQSEVDRVSVTGTGKNGAIKKSDLIVGLRAWDALHPSEE